MTKYTAWVGGPATLNVGPGWWWGNDGEATRATSNIPVRSKAMYFMVDGVDQLIAIEV